MILGPLTSEDTCSKHALPIFLLTIQVFQVFLIVESLAKGENKFRRMSVHCVTFDPLLCHEIRPEHAIPIGLMTVQL